MVDFNAEWYGKFLNHTNEKNRLVSEISDLLVGKSHESCLEIGLGISPYFARELAPRFDRYVIMEKRCVDSDLPQNVGLVNEDWETSELDGKFDVVIASHVIYYFQDKEKAVEKMFDALNDNGRVFFGVNGKQADYGPIKLAFADMLGEGYSFTYDQLHSILAGRNLKEYTVPSEIRFKSYEDLFETLRIVFDNYPEEYEALRPQMMDYMRANIHGNKFRIEQKIVEVEK